MVTDVGPELKFVDDSDGRTSPILDDGHHIPPGHATILVTRGVFRMWNSVLEEVYLRIFSVTFLQIQVHCGHNNFSANNSSGRATPPVLRGVRGHEPKTSPK